MPLDRTPFRSWVPDSWWRSNRGPSRSGGAILGNLGMLAPTECLFLAHSLRRRHRKRLARSLSLCDRLAFLEERVQGAALSQMLYQRSLDIENRLDSILRLVRQGAYSTRKLAEKLGVSIPTISRDVTALRQRGHTIRSTRTDDGWSFVLDEKKPPNGIGEASSKSAEIGAWPASRRRYLSRERARDVWTQTS